MKTLKDFMKGYKQKSADLEKEVDKLTVDTKKDPAGNGDDVFNASKVKPVKRKETRHGYAAGEDESVYEEVEELDELSKKTLKAYGSKALRAGLNTDDENLANKRLKGSNLASAKVYPSQYDKSPLKAKVNANEEVEQVDELSKTTLGNYIKQAKSDVRYAGKQYVRARQDNDEGEKKYADKLARKRYKGINQAVDRLTKEEVELEEKHLTPAEMKKREEIVKAIKRENPGMDKAKAYAIATARAKDVAEGKVPTADEPTEHDKKMYRKVRNLLDKEKKPVKEETIDESDEGWYTHHQMYGKISKENWKKGWRYNQHKPKPFYHEPSGKWHSSIKEDVEEIDEVSGATLGSYIVKSRADEKARRDRGIKIRDELRKQTGLNLGTPIDRKLHSSTVSRSAGQRQAMKKLAGQARVNANEEVELAEGPRGESPTAGTRVVSKHAGKDGYHAEVRYNPDWQEYQVHHYHNGKHLGEGPVSYHGEGREGKKDATDTAEHSVKHYHVVSGKVRQMSEDVEVIDEKKKAPRDEYENEWGEKEVSKKKVTKRGGKREVEEEVDHINEAKRALVGQVGEYSIHHSEDPGSGEDRYHFTHSPTKKNHGYLQINPYHNTAKENHEQSVRRQAKAGGLSDDETNLIVKHQNKLLGKNESVDQIDENWGKGSSSSYHSDRAKAAEYEKKANSTLNAAKSIGKSVGTDHPKYRKLMGDYHSAMAKHVKHAYHGNYKGGYPSQAYAKKDYNTHIRQAKEYRSEIKEEAEQIDELSKGTLRKYERATQYGGTHKNVKGNQIARAKLHGTADGYRARVPANEEAEQIDELDTATLKSYRTKARAQGNAIVDKMKMGGGDWSKDQKDTKTLRKRAAGAQASGKQLVKRGESLKTEEVEQVDELSKATLRSYAQNAKDQMSRSDTISGREMGARNAGNKPSGRERFHNRRADKRYAGLGLAIDKLARNEEVEQVDELSKGTLGRYVNRAQGSTLGMGLKMQRELQNRSSDKERGNTSRKINNRFQGVTRAVKRLTKEDVINRAIEQYVPEDVKFTPEERIIKRLDGLSESHFNTLMGLFETLNRDNQLKMIESAETREGINQLLNFVLENRGE